MLKSIVRALGALAALSLFACSSAGKKADPYAYSVNQAFGEIEAPPSNRMPATDVITALQADFASLRNGYEIAVFPKVTNRTRKSRRAPRRSFAGPVLFEVSAQRLLECGKLMQEDSPQWQAKDAFQGEVQDQDLCAILRFRIKSGQTGLHDEIRELRLYLSSGYRAHAWDIDVQAGLHGEIATRRLKLDPKDPASSALTLYPVDLPALDRIVSLKREPLSIPADAGFRAKLTKSRIALCAEAYSIPYRDAYESNNQVYWCAGDAWPSWVETERSIAVLKVSRNGG